MRIAVAGGTGLIGRFVVDAARAAGTVDRPVHPRGGTIPDLAAGEAGRLDRLLRTIAERERLLQQQAGLLAELRELAVTGFAGGALTTDAPVFGPNSE